jgi:hypothetical protein
MFKYVILAPFFGPDSCYSSSVRPYKGLKFENNNGHSHIKKVKYFIFQCIEYTYFHKSLPLIVLKEWHGAPFSIFLIVFQFKKGYVVSKYCEKKKDIYREMDLLL